MTFTVTSAGPDKLGLAEICQRHGNELWVPAHLDEEQAAEFVLDHFRLAMQGELEMFQVSAVADSHA